MKKLLLRYYRSLPWFKGKLRLGKLLFKNFIEQNEAVVITAHEGIIYHLPNTRENLGIELMINGIYEEDIVRFLKMQIDDNSIYFDIGANIGSLGLPVLKSKKHVEYHAFEASPMVFGYLQQNMLTNAIQNYHLVNKLVHKDGQQKMKFYQSDLYGKSSLAPTYSIDFIMMESISIDSYCEQQHIQLIDWMKIDVQGFEWYVFEGMKEMLAQRKVKNILFEFEKWAEEAAGLVAGTAKNYLQEIGYGLFTLEGKPWIEDLQEKDTMIWAKPLHS